MRSLLKPTWHSSEIKDITLYLKKCCSICKLKRKSVVIFSDSKFKNSNKAYYLYLHK